MQSTNSDGRFLYAFDFDHTIVDGNSDTAIHELAVPPIPDEVHRFYNGANWTEYMNVVFRYLWDHGVKVDDIINHVKDMKLTKGELYITIQLYVNRFSITNVAFFVKITGMGDLLVRIGQAVKEKPQDHLVIMSDANDLFIKARMAALDVPVNAIFTNPATLSEDNSLLQISPFENQTCCQVCPKNLCKGKVLQKYLEDKGPFDRVYYFGDGGNDFCPASKLTENDVVFVREGYKLAKVIREGKYKNITVEIKAKVVFFSDARTIIDSLEL